jgi:molecular chaperone GrpE
MAGGYDWRSGRAGTPGPSGFGDRAGGGSPSGPGAPTSRHSGAGEDPLDRDPARAGDDEVVDAEIVGDDEHVGGGAGGGGAHAGEQATPEASGPFGAGDPLSVALDERDEYLDALRRLQAEFENYRKRVAKQQTDQVAQAAASLVDKLLPVLDTLDLAAEHLGDAESTDGKALLAASSLLHGVLSKEGLERVDPIGEVFDPTAHEAVGHLPEEEGAELQPGTESQAGASGAGVADPVVAQVMRPGYRWKGSVVRPAMVVVRG